MTSSEDILLQMPNVRHKKDDGTLYLMTERLAFERGNTLILSQRYADIKSQKISPEGKAKIQLQIVLYNNNSFTFHFMNPQGSAVQYKDRDQVKELLLDLLPKFRRKVNEEYEEKTKLLVDHPALLQLYKDLVTGGIIDSEEFWLTHAQNYLSVNKLSISNKQNHTKQDVGVSSGFLSGIQPETDGANGIRYNLSVDIIESIFKTYPAVKKKHAESVPALMTESQFWIKFFQSHYFHRDRLPSLKDHFSDCAKSDDREMRRELERMRVSGTNEVIQLLEDNSEKVLFDEKEEPTSKADKIDKITTHSIQSNMIKRFNQHSIMVLKACERQSSDQKDGGGSSSGMIEPSKQNGSSSKTKNTESEVSGISTDSPDTAPGPGPSKKSKIMDKIRFEDLEMEEDTNYQALNLTRVDRYLNGPIADLKTDQITPQELQQTIFQMREFANRWAVKPQLLESKTALNILGELSPGGILMKTAHSEISSEQSLAPEIETELQNLYRSLTELLRHFWACFPITSTALEEKLTRTHETLQKFEAARLQQVKDRLIRDHLPAGTLLAHCHTLLRAAHDKYAQWAQRKRR